MLDDTIKVHQVTHKQLNELGTLEKVYNIQMEFLHSLTDMELNGLSFDQDKANSIISEYTEKSDAINSRLLEIAGEPRLNLSSGQQLSAFLYGGEVKLTWKEWVVQELKVRPESRYYEKKFEETVTLEGVGFVPLPKSQMADERYYSTSKDTISLLKAKTKLQKEVQSLLIEISKYQKIIETLKGAKEDSGLLNKIQMDGKIHPSFNNARTKTGRLSSSDPNGQNMPRGNTSPIKECIISEN